MSQVQRQRQPRRDAPQSLHQPSPYYAYSPIPSPSSFTPRSTADLLRGGGPGAGAGAAGDRPDPRQPPALRTTNLIPRDYLAQRPDASAARNYSTHQIPPSLRSAAPAPSQPPVRPPVSQGPATGRSTALQRDLSSSPEEVSPLHTAHSSAFPVPPAMIADRIHSSASCSPVSPLERGQQGANVSQPREKSSYNNMSKPESYNELRKASDPPPAVTTGPGMPLSASPTPSAANSIATTMADRTGQRPMPRTSSIDSAISSISSNSTSNKSALDPSTVTPADIANLIAAAGSAEAVIIHLLKEKQHAASQNAQLWRLVDKQRTMVFGLNKDLERATKEKEKYRKQLKELQSARPALPAGAAPASSTQQGAGSSEINNAKSQPDTNARGSVDDPAMYPSPLQFNNSQPPARPVAPDSDRSTPVEQEMGNQTPGNKEEKKSGVSGDSPTTGIEARLPPPNRRPPPAPLNLTPTERVSAHRGPDVPDDGSGSEYDDDILEVEEIPSFDRGRRRTREADDRQREALMIKEQAARSASNKKKLKNIEPPESVQKTQVQGFPGMGLPASPRPVPNSPPLSGRASPPESLASVMNPSSSDAGSSDRRVISPPPMSPGLPLSPRPVDRPMNSPMPRMPKSNHMSPPPMSPRNGLPLSPRAPTYPPRSHPSNSEDTQDRNISPTKHSPDVPSPRQAEYPKSDIPTFGPGVKVDGNPPSPQKSPIYRGLVSFDYPGLLLPPSSLPSIDVKVVSSRLRPSRHSYLATKPLEEEPVFTLGVFSRANRSELWRVEKVIMALPQLDQQLRQIVPNYNTRLLPDRSIFNGHSPAKVDARRAALNNYFATLLEMPKDEAAALVLCEFLTADAIEPRDDETNFVNGDARSRPALNLGPDGKPRIEGYLTKKGKNFGGWKARYFVLHGPELKYFESPGGAHMGTIRISHAQIGIQSQSGHNQSPSRSENDSDNQCRHAFLILEPKKKDSGAFVRHALCAESDEERDSWVEALLSYVENPPEDEDDLRRQAQASRQETSRKLRTQPSSKKGNKGIDSPDPEQTEILRSFSYDDVVAAEAPVRGLPSGKQAAGTVRSNTVPENLSHQAGWEQNVPSSPSLKNISGPTNGVKIEDAGAWGNKTPTTTKEKKRSIWGFRAPAAEPASQAPQGQGNGARNSPVERREASRPIFGLPLAEAAEFCGPYGIECGLPSVVYRCIEYLRAKNAALEEGIFRLSGSNVVIKGLKERFNTEGDVDFLESDHYYDVHAVASLFKQYLRELPSTVLTRELHLDFIRVLELDDREKKIAAFHGLVHRLPKPNLTLLTALSQYLIVIVNNSDVNKMTIRNVGIVFAPTLNIPAPVFSMFLTDFDRIFGDVSPVAKNQPVDLPVIEQPLNPEDIRSPRHQMFSDLPTPAYNQGSFQPGHGSEPGGDAAGYRDQQESYDTGFMPIQSTHELGGNNPQYSSMNGMLGPGNKAKRRESNMLFMMGNRKNST